MDTIINLLQNNSSVTTEEQNNWTLISNSAIRHKTVQPITNNGLIQVIDRAAYEIATTTHVCVLSGVSDDEWDNLTAHESELLDKIQHTAALASGVHPQIIADVIKIRTDYYLDCYIEQMDDNHG